MSDPLHFFTTRMPRFKLIVEYAGGRYSGWQIQKNARTVQGEIDRAVREATGRREFELYGAGRTDAGVHALAQVAHLEIYTDLPPETLRRRVNDSLPPTSTFARSTKWPHRFHARHDAVSRSYVYQIAHRKSAFFKPYVWWIKEPIDVGRMRAAAEAFVGMKDFASFTADEPDEKSTHVLVDRAGDRAARRPDARPNSGLALSVAHGPPPGRRACRRRSWRTDRRRPRAGSSRSAPTLRPS